MKDAEGDQEDRVRYRELLEELRTIIPGAQVLFAFLLSVPFSSHFDEIDTLGRAVFLVSLVAIALATVLFLSPAAHHRLADYKDRQERLQFGVRTALCGMFLVALAMSCAMFVVVRFLFDSLAIGIGGAVAVAAAASGLWLLLPMTR
ncbi:DUF6328 family protein [Aurantimonas sp. VKM B-3413]|uniref:DUF6328 family protein n=1 Tax=Aurantimonas sp. VKM B-3413 TaxID=2779401 RepID=UPI001E628B97|nr:DUF6328 family protein [Aurantimonas sp. VKM B-3413]MCB8835832.1 DUF6328 family protein [Aurantimonas sp. VKM B-3413]